ncbi:MAG: Gar1/Naf1 family protein [Methanobacteriota archaeon]
MRIAVKALHMTPRGLVSRGDSAPKMGQSVLDTSNKRIGNVSDIFGPINSPYFMVKPASGVSKVDLEKLVGSNIFMGESYAESRKSEKYAESRKSEKMSRMRKY